MCMRQMGTSISGYFAEAAEFVNKFANNDIQLAQRTCGSRMYNIQYVAISIDDISLVVALRRRGISKAHARSNYVAKPKMATPSDIRSL